MLVNDLPAYIGTVLEQGHYWTMCDNTKDLFSNQ